jgi:phytoene synthase
MVGATQVSSVSRSYAFCEALSRREAGNFYHAFRILPGGQRRAMCALYAFFRIADDLADEDGPVEEKRARLETWRGQLHAALAGTWTHPIHPALTRTIETCGIPVAHLEDVLDGVCMDLDVARYDTFADLYGYCYRVASAVGLCCIHVWGFRSEARQAAAAYAEAAGIAFQLTNILRDLGEDVARGRVYLPREDLQRFGYDEEKLALGKCDEPFRALMRFEMDRARRYYDASRPLERLLSRSGRAVFGVLWRTYRALLDEIERRDFDVFRERVRVSTWRKLWLAARALPIRWGLL